MTDRAVSDCYGVYKHARNAAWHTLIDYGIEELPVSTSRLAYEMNAAVIPYSEKIPAPIPGITGHAECIDGKWALFFEPETVPSGRARFTIAHEIGHIFLGHRLNGCRFYGDASEETAASTFAARLLAPACVLWALQLKTPEEICEVTGLSYQAAIYRARRMRELQRRNRFLADPLEKQVYDQFLPFIESKKKHAKWR